MFVKIQDANVYIPATITSFSIEGNKIYAVVGNSSEILVGEYSTFERAEKFLNDMFKAMKAGESLFEMPRKCFV